MASSGWWCLPLALGIVGCGPPPPSHAPPVSPSPSATLDAASAATRESEAAPEPQRSEAPVDPPSEAAADIAADAEPKPIEPVPVLVDEAGEPLPQTDERPSADSASLEARLELLVQAIEKDQPELAMPAFFPVIAYQQVKAIAKPERDWEYRLVAAFKRNVHEYHRKLGDAAKDVEFVGIEVPEAQVRFMKPNSEGNRIGYFRVLRSRLKLKKPDDSEVALEITSMISWRGEWYVVHLHGFK